MAIQLNQSFGNYTIKIIVAKQHTPLRENGDTNLVQIPETNTINKYASTKGNDGSAPICLKNVTYRSTNEGKERKIEQMMTLWGNFKGCEGEMLFICPGV